MCEPCPYSLVQQQQQQQQHRDTAAVAEADAAAEHGGGGEDGGERGMDFRLTTFNLLAPCYKRMHSEAPPIAETATGLLANQNRARAKRTARESEFDHVWRERALETVRPHPSRNSPCDASCSFSHQEFSTVLRPDVCIFLCGSYVCRNAPGLC